MRKLYDNLFLVNEGSVENTIGSTFLLTRRGGNILFTTKFDVSEHLGDIEKKGTLSHLLVGDRHHVSSDTVKLAKTVGLPLTGSALEAKVLAKKKLVVDDPLEYVEQTIVTGLQALPTPGHTEGAFSYLYTTRTRRILFIGDTLVPADGEWKIWVSKTRRPVMRQTLEMLLTLDFDVMVCNSFAATDGAVVELTTRQKNARLRKVLKSLDS